MNKMKPDPKALTTRMVVLYDCQMPFDAALRRGLALFDAAGINPNEFGCSITPPLDSSALGVKTFKRAANLMPLLDDPDLEYVVVAATNGRDPAESVSFYFGRNRVSSDFYQLIINQPISETPVLPDRILFDFIHGLDQAVPLRYGFGCALPRRRVSPQTYADAQALFLPFIDYENPALWQTEVPNYLSDTASPQRYLAGKLRLVYPLNLVTRKHLDMPISGSSLEAWVKSNPEHGQLTAMGADLWRWEVASEHLPYINRECAHAGLLIAWKMPATPAAKRPTRLP